MVPRLWEVALITNPNTMETSETLKASARPDASAILAMIGFVAAFLSFFKC